MSSLTDTLRLAHGGTIKNRLMLAPLTNCQSHDDGRLSDDEYRWLTTRAEGGFGLTMTCAATVQKSGLGFRGQLGIYDDMHNEGLARLARGIRAHDSHAVVQLHHAGMRAPANLTGRAPGNPSDDTESGAKAMTDDEVRASIEAFIEAACRADRAGFDGVELHGAHGYLICAFLSPELNRRLDDFGGTLQNRTRFLFDVVEGIRGRCRPNFTLGVRLSTERFGLRLPEMQEVAQRLMAEAKIDYLDLSLFDSFKEPEDPAFRGRSLMSYFTDLDRGSVLLGAAGKLRSGADVDRVLSAGMDFVVVGRAAILHRDFARRIIADATFRSIDLPVSREYLRGEGLAPAFLNYLQAFPNFLTPSTELPAPGE